MLVLTIVFRTSSRMLIKVLLTIFPSWYALLFDIISKMLLLFWTLYSTSPILMSFETQITFPFSSRRTIRSSSSSFEVWSSESTETTLEGSISASLIEIKILSALIETFAKKFSLYCSKISLTLLIKVVRSETFLKFWFCVCKSVLTINS